jgi:hypothetical protein
VLSFAIGFVSAAIDELDRGRDATFADVRFCERKADARSVL